MVKTKSFRATFEDVLMSQETLRRWLDRLVDENRLLKPEERSSFMQLVARAMIGQGQRVPICYWNPDNKPAWWFIHCGELSDIVRLETAEDILRFLAYWDGKGKIYLGDEKELGASPAKLWKIARQLALKTFPLALAQAAQMSPERIPYEPTLAERF